MTSSRRFAAVLILAIAGIALAAPAAWAHAGLLSSDPASGATLSTAPTEVTLTFTEEPDLALSYVHVLNTVGADVGAEPARAGADAKQLVLPLPPDLSDGSYTVSWVVISADDGHRTAGAFAFGVGTAPAPIPSDPAIATTPSPPPLGVAGKTLLYAGLSLAVGAVATAWFAFGGLVPARRRLLPVAGALTVVGALMMLFAERATVGVPIFTLFHARAGKPYLWLTAGAVLTLITALASSRTSSRRWLGALGLAATATMLARVEGGHAAAQDWAWFQIIVQWLHFLAVGVWVGGFVPVLLLLRERRGEPADASLAAQARRFSTMAGGALLVVAITGVVRAVDSLGGVGAVTHIFDTSYGIVLAIKVAVALVLIALGSLNRFRSISRMEAGDAGMLRRVMRLEVVTAVGLFVLTAVLTGLPPNPPAAPQPAPPSRITASASDFATTMTLSLTATPGTPGPNTFVLDVADFDTGEPLADVTEVSLTFTVPARTDIGESSLDLERGPAGLWTGRGTNLSLAGTWQVTTLVVQGARSTTVPLTLTTAAPPQQIVTSPPTPGQPTIYTMTLAGGQQIQAYNDPGTPGPNQLHVTAFDPEGSELPLRSIALSATPEDGTPRTLEPTRFSAGHFVASEVLTDGAWHFDIQATARDGSVLQAFFDQTIGDA